MNEANELNRDELFSILRELWETLPDMRFGQLVVNVSYLAREPSAEAPWDVEDEEFLNAARRLLHERTSAVEA
jgi:hypothetical protein